MLLVLLFGPCVFSWHVAAFHCPTAFGLNAGLALNPSQHGGLPIRKFCKPPPPPRLPAPAGHDAHLPHIRPVRFFILKDSWYLLRGHGLSTLTSVKSSLHETHYGVRRLGFAKPPLPCAGPFRHEWSSDHWWQAGPVQLYVSEPSWGPFL